LEIRWKELNNFVLKNDYYVEREKWLHSLKSKITPPIADSIWTIKNIFHVSDNVFHDIYRNTFISYLAIEYFRNDVIETAKKHREHINERYTKYDLELSVAYVIEEIAINIRLRVIDNIDAEYYLGELPKPLLKLYKNKYQVNVLTIAGKQKSDIEFKFFHSPNKLEKHHWIEVLV
jgi:Zn-finger domain-containing protein